MNVPKCSISLVLVFLLLLREVFSISIMERLTTQIEFSIELAYLVTIKMKNDMSPNDSVDDYEFVAAAAEDIAFMIPTDCIVSLNDYQIMMMLMNSQMKSTMSFI